MTSTSARVVSHSVLRDIATSGRACVLSIHQSSTNIYAMFDKLFLLAPHGTLPITF
jgi:ABC-type multidrug transport system ATPase subunit